MNSVVEKSDIEEIQSENLLKSKEKIDKAYINCNKIIEKELAQKFGYFDDWQFKYTKLLLDEAVLLEQKIPLRTFKKYKRGTIVKVDFGVGLGSEMSQVHYAIVLNKYDNPRNNVLTVVPLTSKASPLNLDLNNLIYDNLYSNLQIELNSCYDENKILIDEVKSEKIITLIKVYRNSLTKHTYACCSIPTTISKTRINNPVNEYDIIGKVICPNEVLDKIDNEIKDRFTF